MTTTGTIRHNWTPQEVLALYEMPLMDLLYHAHTIHRQNFDPNAVQISTILNFKTGGCPENCAYCPQSAHYKTFVEKQPTMQVEEVLAAAQVAKDNGASRFCMAGAWRSPPKKDFPVVLEIVKQVKAMGLETCLTVGMLSEDQVQGLKEAGLDFYNHNLDTSPEYYPNIIDTRTYQDRLDTIEKVRNAKIKVCSGGIIGIGETREDRAGLLIQLANLPEHPVSVPINMLAIVPGTPLGDAAKPFCPIEFIRSIAIARLMMPKSFVRLSAGRYQMSKEMQAMCFFAGANSIHYGEKLLTTPNCDMSEDRDLFKQLGLKPYEVEHA